jgi:hypothetical protein
MNKGNIQNTKYEKECRGTLLIYIRYKKRKIIAYCRRIEIQSYRTTA